MTVSTTTVRTPRRSSRPVAAASSCGPSFWPSRRDSAPGGSVPSCGSGIPRVEHAVVGLGDRGQAVAPCALRQCLGHRPAEPTADGSAPRRGRGRARSCAPARCGSRPSLRRPISARALGRDQLPPHRAVLLELAPAVLGQVAAAEHGDAEREAPAVELAQPAHRLAASRPRPRAPRAGRAPPAPSPAGRSPRRATSARSPRRSSLRSSGASVSPWPSSVTKITPK